MLESRAERIALGAAQDIAAVADVGLNFLESQNRTAESREQKID